MTEHFEEELSRTTACAPAAGVGGTDLHLTSIALGERMRRRRIGAGGGGAGPAAGRARVWPTAWMRASNTDRPPVTTHDDTQRRRCGPRVADPRSGRNRVPGAPTSEVATVRERCGVARAPAADAGAAEEPGRVRSPSYGSAGLPGRPAPATSPVPQPEPATAGDRRRWRTEVTGVEPGPGRLGHGAHRRRTADLDSGRKPRATGGRRSCTPPTLAASAGLRSGRPPATESPEST